MRFLPHLVCLALALGPQSTEWILSPAPPCEDRQDCCTTDETCPPDCVECACCAVHPTSLTPDVSLSPLDSPPTLTVTPPSPAPAPPPPADILHVPKSR